MSESPTESRKEAYERRKKAREQNTIKDDEVESSQTPGIRIGATAEDNKGSVTKRVKSQKDPNRKTLRLHPDIRLSIEEYAEAERRNFSDVLKEILIAGMRNKQIIIKKSAKKDV